MRRADLARRLTPAQRHRLRRSRSEIPSRLANQVARDGLSRPGVATDRRARRQAFRPFVFHQRRTMRSPDKPLVTRDVAKNRVAKNLPTPPSAAIIALTRLGFGPRPGEVEAFDALGASDAERLQVWTDQQLDPSSIDDSAAAARLAESGFQTLDKSLEQLWQDHATSEEWEIQMQPLWETRLATFVRAIHSQRQLPEVLADFWHTHFSVFADEWPEGPTWVHTDRDAIRANALGNFRQMVEAVTRTPAMLFYLDNAFNSQEDANENYARELMELHTIGAEAYLGSLPQDEVPLDDNGIPIGYVEDDVIGAARCLTGWTVETMYTNWDVFDEVGTFIYWDPWHDHDSKRVVGLDLPADQGPMQDGWDLLDRLCQHPATARHIAGKLCRRLLGDFPPASVVDAAAEVFSAQHAAPDQIAQVVRTIVLAPEFLDTWADKVKRPFEIAVSCFRGAESDLAFTLNDDVTLWFDWVFYLTGQPLFGWHPPNGYPDVKFAWNTTSPRVMGWRLANFFVTLWDEDAEDFYFDLVGQTPGDVRSAQALVDFWGQRILGRAPTADEEQRLVDFMAADENPLDDLPWDWDTHERLRATVALIFMSPSFLWR